MVNISAAFPTPWGYEDLLTNSTTNMINSSITVWKSVGEGQIGLLLGLGMIPFLLGFMVYIRYQKVTPTIFGILLGNIFLHVFRIMPITYIKVVYIIVILGLGLSLYGLWNKKVGN